MKDAYENLPEELRKDSSFAEEIKYRQERKKQYEARRKKRGYFVVGLIIIIFALIGLVGVIWSCVSAISGHVQEKELSEYKAYNQYLIPVCAVDPEPFDDITAAPMEELVEISVWSIIGSDLDPNKYDYSSGELAIPAEEVEAAFYKFFSSQVQIEHCTVTGYGYEFKYNEEKNLYYIPLTTIEPLYTPKVTSIEKSGGATVISLGLINAGAWQQNSETGDIEEPSPDKYIKVTLRQFEEKLYISSIQTSGLPETAIVGSLLTTKPAETEAPEEEGSDEEGSAAEDSEESGTDEEE